MESTPTEPAGAEIRHADGRVTKCTLVRDGDDPDDGLARWIAIAPAETLLGSGDSFFVAVLPGRTKVRVEVAVAD